jgi:hypothetical protein
MFLIVEPGHLGFVRQFGKIQRENLPPGIHVHFPPPIPRGEAYPVQEVRRINIGFEETDQNSRTVTLVEGGVYQEALYITGDENIIDLNYVIQYMCLSLCLSLSDQSMCLLFIKKPAKYSRFLALDCTFHGRKHGCKD